jgi:hypothetical protein
MTLNNHVDKLSHCLGGLFVNYMLHDGPRYLIML